MSDDWIARRAAWVRGGCVGEEPPLGPLPAPEEPEEALGARDTGKPSTRARRRFLGFVGRFLEGHGRPPTIREIAEGMGTTRPTAEKWCRVTGTIPARERNAGALAYSLADVRLRSRVLALLRDSRGAYTHKQIAEALGCHVRSVAKETGNLRREGLIRVAGRLPGWHRRPPRMYLEAVPNSTISIEIIPGSG